jgi:hypothetical protein
MPWTRVAALIGSICVKVACTATQQPGEPGANINWRRYRGCDLSDPVRKRSGADSGGLKPGTNEPSH